MWLILTIFVGIAVVLFHESWEVQGQECPDRVGVFRYKEGNFACCEAACEGCGGWHCSSFTGGWRNCCVSAIVNSGASCLTNDAPCLYGSEQNQLDQTCPDDGILGDEGDSHVCCSDECGTCGGNDCQDLPGGADKCCVTNIIDSGVPCEEADTAPPCILLVEIKVMFLVTADGDKRYSDTIKFWTEPPERTHTLEYHAMEGVAMANMVMANSDIPLTFKSVHFGPASFANSQTEAVGGNGPSHDSTQLRNWTESDQDTLRLREDTKADVILVLDYGAAVSSCGYGIQGDYIAFVSSSCQLRRYIPQTLSRLMGCFYDERSLSRYASPEIIEQLVPAFGYEHYEGDKWYCDVMASICDASKGDVEMPHISNPDVWYNGTIPTGSDRANCAAVVKQNMVDMSRGM